MKKIVTFLGIMTVSIYAKAEGEINPFTNENFMRDLVQTSAIILVVTLLSSFILSIIRMALDSRIKTKLIEKGASETIVSQLLQPLNKENKNMNFKWFAVFAGIGVGLALIDVFQPLGIHSFAIMAFCLAGSFLGYYFFAKKSA
jgi:hypothetical protein